MNAVWLSCALGNIHTLSRFGKMVVAGDLKRLLSEPCVDAHTEIVDRGERLAA